MYSERVVFVDTTLPMYSERVVLLRAGCVGVASFGCVASAPALQLRGLTKRYDNGFLALEDFDLEIPDGAFFGLLGPNGAGKTTPISAVCNLIRVTGGSISIFGEAHDSLTARGWVGLAEQD